MRWALGYALKSPSFDLLGVTVTDADTPQRARLAAKLLYRLGRTDVPVAVGRQTPAVPPDRVDYQFTWAEDFQAYKPVATPAVEFLADMIRKNPGELTLIAVGPLQNIGDLVRQHPDVVPLVKRVVLMSGSIGAELTRPGAGGRVEREAGHPRGAGGLCGALAGDHRAARLDHPTSGWKIANVRRSQGQHAAGHRARSAAAAVDGAPGQPHDAARSAGTRRGAASRPLFRPLRAVPLRVDDEGYTRVDKSAGRPVRSASNRSATSS